MRPAAYFPDEVIRITLVSVRIMIIDKIVRAAPQNEPFIGERQLIPVDCQLRSVLNFS